MPRIPPVKFDSTQFHILLSKFDSLKMAVAMNKPDTFHPPPIIGNTVKVHDIEVWELSWWMEILIIPLLIGILVFGITWILTKYSDKRKEYLRIKNLNNFFNIWIDKNIPPIDQQIELCKEAEIPFMSIDNKNTPVFEFSIMDLKRILEINNEDLYKLFISIKNGDKQVQNENFYELIFNLTVCQSTLEHYKARSEINLAKCKKQEEKVTTCIYNLKLKEDTLFIKRKQLWASSVSNSLSTMEKEVANRDLQELTAFITKYDDIRKKNGEEPAKDKEEKANEIVLLYTEKKLNLCNTLPLTDSTLTSELRTSSFELIAAIKDLTALYAGVVKEINSAIREFSSSKEKIIEMQDYFNKLPFCKLSKWNEG